MTTRSLFLSVTIATLALLLAASGCGEDPDGNGSDNNAVDTDDCLEPGAFPTDIDEDTTVEADCYEIDSDVSVDSGTLTIQPGTVLVFHEGREVDVDGDGRLNAEGTEDAPIVFTGIEEIRGYWKGIRFIHSNSTDNVFRHAIVEYGGGDDWNRTEPANLAIDRSRIDIEETTLRHADGYGLFARDGQQSHLTMSGANALTDNEAPARVEDPKFVPSFSTDDDHTGNDEDLIRVGSGDVTGTPVWEPLDVLMTFRDVRAQDDLLEIGAGFEMVFRQDGELTIENDGRLTISGTADDPVILRGQESTPGFWRGVRFMGTFSENNRLEHTTIRDGGSRDWSRFSEGANLSIDNARVAASDLTLTNSGGNGIGVVNDDTVLDFECATLQIDDGWDSDISYC